MGENGRQTFKKYPLFECSIAYKKVIRFKKRFLSKMLLILIISSIMPPKLSIFNWSVLNAQTESCNINPDIIYYNGTIITMDPVNPIAEALAIKSDSIMAVGPTKEILKLLQNGCSTQVFDLRGLTVLPGFNDSHSHWLGWREHICSVTNDTTYPSLEEIMSMLSANGWTSISELNFGRPDYAPEHLNNALNLDSQGKLSVRVNGYWGTLDDGLLIEVLEDSSHTPDKIYSESERVKAPGVKMYVDDPFGTTDILTQDQTNQLVQMAHGNGWQIAAHAVNESAVEKILTAYENVLGAESNENYRHRIEHAVKVSDDQLTRMKQKSIIASFQLMGPPDWPNQFTFQNYISNTNPEWCLRWNDFIGAESQGLRITGSTDAPFNDAPCDYSPFRVIYQAVTRKGYLDREHAGWELTQRLSVEDCLKLLTINGAYVTFEEDKKGSLSPGKYADLTIISENPLGVTIPEDLLNIKVYLTMVGGDIEYCDNSNNNDLCSPLETFKVDSTLITASKYLEDQTPNLAFDNNAETNWGSGDFAPQWIQIDLMDEFKITGIDLIIDQWPAGQTVHQIWAKGDNPQAVFELIHVFNGNTEINQLLNYTAPSDLAPYRYIKILTTQSPSWIAWKEIRIYKQGATFVNENYTYNPHFYKLEQNYPNPFNPSTKISWQSPVGSRNTIKVYDILGREVATLVDEYKQAGKYEIEFSAEDLPSGVYFYQVKAGEFVNTKKMLLIK